MGSGADGIAPLNLLVVVLVFGLLLLFPWTALWRLCRARGEKGGSPCPWWTILRPSNGMPGLGIGGIDYWRYPDEMSASSFEEMSGWGAAHMVWPH